MNPACELCRGACCEGFRLPDAMFNSDDLNTWLNNHGQKEGNHIYFPCPCGHFKDGKCLIYNFRPDVCKQFEVGGVPCRRAITRNRPRKHAEAIWKLLS